MDITVLLDSAHAYKEMTVLLFLEKSVYFLS